MPTVPTLGEIVKEFRDANGMSQLEFALAIGLTSGQAISNLENGVSKRMNTRPYAATAKLLGITPAELTARTKGVSENEAIFVPKALAEMIRKRADEEKMNIPDLIATLLARRPGKKKGA